MNDAQKMIDSVLTEHQFDWGNGGTRCSGKNCRDWRGYPMQHRQHLAAEIDAALGGLTRAWSAVLPDDSYFGPYHESHEVRPGDARQQAEADVAEYEDSALKSRWVSGWSGEASQ